ncbi:macrophage mannose receptor 1-like [Astyanax mexicanus]|uniref:macrophage mannose receptor 1-like n=1 Tax=Astyanax mexicanus TaxID=7994 RepID=UPI0020CACADE|nr:macrophage mannose receptor 1-like [Astyanax mexicanus]
MECVYLAVAVGHVTGCCEEWTLLSGAGAEVGLRLLSCSSLEALQLLWKMMMMMMKNMIAAVFLLLFQTLHCSAQPVLLIYNAHENRCLGNNLQVLEVCDPQNPGQQFRWTSENRIFNVAEKKCLGTENKTEGSKLQWYQCDADSDLQKWECENNSLFGLKNESLYLSIQDYSNSPIVSSVPGEKGKWTLHGMTDSICSHLYEELYTLKGNALGRPCHFPFLYNDKWYTNCTTEGRSPNLPWCAVESEYEPNQLWGYCPTQLIVNELWRKSPLTDVYYQVNEGTALTWYQARKSCQQQGGDLLSITEPHEQTFISGLTDSTGPVLWTGLNSLDALSGWRWVNGQPLHYLKWLSGQPSSLPGYSCGVLDQSHDSGWSTAVCSERHGYICQRGLITPTVPPVVHTGSCHSPWISYSGHCYLLSRTKRTWLEARDSCRREGGDLLSILNIEEQSFTITQLGYAKTDELWIGFNDLKTNMLFEWSDHSRVPYVLWDVNEPSNNVAIKEDCVMMRGEEGKWADQICQNKYGYICKKKAQSESDTYITNPVCKPGWVRYGNYCYLTGSGRQTFEEAKQMCENAGSYLADVTNSVENAFLVSLIGAQPEKHFWIGLSNQEDQSTFEWTNNMKVPFTHFNHGMPGGKQGCVGMTTGVLAGLWDVLSCTNAEKYICKQKAERVITTLPPATTPAVSCSPGWNPLTNRDFCFKVYEVEHSQQKTWSEALDFCRELGGDLLSLHSANDIKTEHRTYYPLDAWIGYSIQDPSVGFTWSDGSSSSYESWDKGEPNNEYSMEKCVILTFYTWLKKERWNDVHCEDRKHWYCEIRKGVTPKEVTHTSKTYNKTDDGWIIFKDNQYYIDEGFDVPMAKARSFCKHRHGDLVAINDEEERVFLWQLIKQKFVDFFIGLRIDLDKSLSWMDGSPVVFQAWQQNQPAFVSDDEHCVKMNFRQGRWANVNCGDNENFICKRRGSVSASATAAPTEPPTGGCPSGWVKFQKKCYKIGLDLKTWTEARSYCKSLGGNLASITDRLQQVFLTSKMDNANIPDLWHGLNNLGNLRLRWTDGSDFLYTDWAKGADNDVQWDHIWGRSYIVHSKPHTCGAMGGGQREELGKWVTKDCNYTSGYICSRNIDQSLQAESPTEVSNTYIKLGNSFYKIVQTNMTWAEAQSYCEAEGAKLASIRDAFTQSYIELQTYKVGQPLWIGLNSMETHGSFQWIDKWHLNMERWDSNEPTLDYPCVYVNVGGMWKTAQCNQTLYSLCKKSTEIPPAPPAQYLGLCPEPAEDEPKMTWLPYKGHCYAFVKRSVQWTKASRMCMARGANLVSILDPMEAKFLQNYLRLFANDYSDYWIGIFKNHAGHWLWVDQSVVEYYNIRQYTASYEFRDVQEMEASLDCAVVSARSLEWGKRHCEDHSPFICKIPKVVVPPTKMASTGEDKLHGPFTGVSVVLVIVVLFVLAGMSYIYHKWSKR